MAGSFGVWLERLAICEFVVDILQPAFAGRRNDLRRFLRRLSRTRCAVSMRTSPIKPEPGRRRIASSPRSNGIRANFGNFLRTLATPETIKDWSLTSLKRKLIKIGAKVVATGAMSRSRLLSSPFPETCSPKSWVDRGTTTTNRHVNSPRAFVLVRSNQEPCKNHKSSMTKNRPTIGSRRGGVERPRLYQQPKRLPT
jgi:hypothetical protein